MTPAEIRLKFALRNRDTITMLQFFTDEKVANNYRDMISLPFQKLAFSLVDSMRDGPELVNALRKLRDTRDAFGYHYLESIAAHLHLNSK